MTMRLVNRLRLRSERALALPMTVLVMATTGAMVVTVVQYSSSSGRTAQVAKARVSAQSLAEAGIAHAFSILNQALDPKTVSTLPTSAAPTVLNLEGGTAKYWGSYNSTTFVWTITSIGSMPNPTGGGALTRRITRAAQIHGLNSGATVGAWNRMFHDDTTNCLVVEDVTIPTPIASRGDLCLVGSGKITGAASTVEVGDDVRMTRNSWSVNRSAGTGVGSGWATPANVVSSNGSKATDSIPLNSQSTNLDATSFGFSIPATATIVGIYAEIERTASGSNVDDEDVFLLKAGVASGNDKADTGDYSTWGDEIEDYGGSTDLWGTTWTPAQINASNFGLRLRVDNDDTGNARTASIDHMRITVYYQPVPTTSIGEPATNILQAHIAGDCTFDTQVAHTPCTAVDKVYATTITTTPAGLSKPQIDMTFWYTNAKPGPNQPCTTTVGTPPVWDNDSSYNLSLPVSDAWSEVTPTNRSYTCQVHDAQNNRLGELSWNHTTHVLTIFGTIFLDGDFRFDDNGQIVHYQGRGIIYAARDIEFDELVCAGGTGTASCVTQAGGMANWDPSQNMMTVLAGDDSEFDQGAPGDQPQTTPSGLQGIIYARDDCLVHENFHLSGPIICDDIQLDPSSNGWPTYYTWPPLGSLTEGQAYGSPNGAADYVVTAGDQLG